MALKAFVKWLADQPGYKRRIKHSDSSYFNPTNHDGRIAKAVREKPVATEAQIQHVNASMPTSSDIEKRDMALVAAVFLTGARDDAIASLSVRYVDLAKRTVFQDARRQWLIRADWSVPEALGGRQRHPPHFPHRI